MRSVVRDVKAMTLGIDVINQEIAYRQNNSKKDRSVKKRHERLMKLKSI